MPNTIVWMTLRCFVKRLPGGFNRCAVAPTGWVRPVLYIVVMMNTEMEAFHRQIWDAVNPVAVLPNKRYHPDRWIPHITLAMEDLTSENIGPITAFLSAYKWKYTFNIQSLSWVTRSLGESMQIENTFGINTEEASR